jgi:hypothetical protein
MTQRNNPSSGGVNALTLELCQLAIDVDRLIDRFESLDLSDGETDLLSVPALHVSICARRLEQLVHEARALDQRPRIERLRAA